LGKTAGVLPLRFAPWKISKYSSAAIMGLNQRFPKEAALMRNDLLVGIA
jgi:hypothetical protein